MLINTVQSYGKYITPISAFQQMKSQTNSTKDQIVKTIKKSSPSFNDVLKDQTISQSLETDKNVTHMEINNLYNTLNSNDFSKIDSLAKKYAHLLIDDEDNVNANSKKDVVNFVINSNTNQNHENMIFMKSLVQNHYQEYSSYATITDHHRGYCDPNDYTVIYAVLSGLRKKNLE